MMTASESLTYMQTTGKCVKPIGVNDDFYRPSQCDLIVSLRKDAPCASRVMVLLTHDQFLAEGFQITYE